MDEPEQQPEREGYTYLGSVGVDSGQLMICDPSYVLREDEATREAARRLGMREVEDTYPTYQEAMDVTLNLASNGWGVLRDEMAVLFLAGYGDGTYPVFGKLSGDGRLVEVVIDMGITPVQRAVLGIEDET